MTTQRLTECVCIWLDETSDTESPAWIVSRDELDDRGQAETTRTLSIHQSEEEALAEGRRACRRLGFPLYRNPANGPAVRVEDVLRVIFDNGEVGDSHFRLEEDEDGLLYESSNAVSRALVCGAMFSAWRIEQEPRRSEWIAELEKQFGSREIAERYFAAATDQDK